MKNNENNLPSLLTWTGRFAYRRQDRRHCFYFQKWWKGMNLMNTEWIEIEDLPRSKANESRKKALKGILDKLKPNIQQGIFG